MPWKCPACSIQIHHLETESAPRLGVQYRCHVCRLELVLDAKSQRLVLAPLSSDFVDDPRRTKPTR
jgi:hypothetical protein